MKKPLELIFKLFKVIEIVKGNKMVTKEMIKIATIIAIIIGLIFTVIEFTNTYVPPACCASLEADMDVLDDKYSTKDGVHNTFQIIQDDILRIEKKIDTQNQNIIGIYTLLVNKKK